MAEVTINIPDEKLSRVLDGFAGYYGYTDTIKDPETGEPIPNPQTKAQHMRAMIIDHIHNVVREQERVAAAEAAMAAVTSIDGIE